MREEEKLQLLDEKLVKFLEELHGDSESSFADMPFIAHYTSLPALENIIQTKEFWFSNPLLMNDKHEVTHFLGLAKNSLIMLEISKSTRPHNLKNDQRLDRFIDEAYKFISDYESNGLLDSFIFCLSKWHADDGKLSMWRGYANNGAGVAVVIDPKKIGSFLDESPLIMSKVLYKNKNEIEKIISDLTNEVIECIVTFNIQDVRASSYTWFFRILLLAFLIKNEGFREEEEYRVVYFPDKDREKKLEHMKSYKITDAGIHPLLKLKIEPLEGVIQSTVTPENLVEKIVLAPTVNSDTAVKALKLMLRKSNIPSLEHKVHASEIPFRNGRN